MGRTTSCCQPANKLTEGGVLHFLIETMPTRIELADVRLWRGDGLILGGDAVVSGQQPLHREQLIFFRVLLH